MTDTATQLARYKKLAQEQAETIRRLREEQECTTWLSEADRAILQDAQTEITRRQLEAMSVGRLPKPTIPTESPRRVWDMKE